MRERIESKHVTKEIKRLSLCTFVRLCAVVIIDISLFSSQATAPKFSQLWSKCSQTAFAM